MLKKILLVLLFLGLYPTINIAQEAYMTTTGLLVIKASKDGQVITINSKDLNIQLDYESGNIKMRQELSALLSSDDSLQFTFNSKSNEFVTFEGKLNLDYINTKEHPPLDFGVEGTLYPQKNLIIGSGHLVHRVQGTSSACLLSLSFTLDPDEVFPAYNMGGWSDEIYVTVIQSLLARTNE